MVEVKSNRQMVRRWWLLGAAVGLLASGPLGAQAADRVVDRVAAVVNNDPILLSEVDGACRYALDQVPASLSLDEGQQRRRKIRLDTIQSLIDDKLVEQQIRENHVEVTDEEVDDRLQALMKDNKLTDEQFAQALQQQGMTLEQFKQQTRDRIKQEKLLRDVIQSRLTVTDKEVQEYYQQHYRRGTGAEKVRASHILFAIPPGATAEQEQAVRQRAEKVLAALKAGADFAAMAKKQSDDPSASLGGDLGWFRRGDMVASFDKAAFGLAKGHMSGLVKTRFGYHIILVTDRASDQPPPLQSVETEIRGRLYKEAHRRLVRGWLDDLRRRSYIDIKL